MSIMDMFRSATPKSDGQQMPQGNQQPAPNSPNPQNLNAHSSAATAPNGVVPPQNTTPAQEPAAEPVPLADFKDLWKAPEVDPNAVDPKQFFNVDIAKLQEAASKVDFSRIVTPDVMKKIAGGGDEAATAFMETFNKGLQASYGQSALATTKIVEAALNKQKESFDKELPALLKRHTMSDTLQNENPAFQNPAVTPIIDGLKSQLAVKYPGASSKELADMAKNYLSGVSTLFAPQTATGDKTNGKSGTKGNDTDWSTFL